MPKKAKPEARRIYLADWLERFEVSQIEAAKIAGCGQPYIANICAGRKVNINTLYLLRLSEHFGITINDFFAPPPMAKDIEALARLSSRAGTTLIARARRKN